MKTKSPRFLPRWASGAINDERFDSPLQSLTGGLTLQAKHRLAEMVGEMALNAELAGQIIIRIGAQ